MTHRSILLTGATGFLGKTIVNELSGEFEIIGLGRSANNKIVCDLSIQIPKMETSMEIIIHAAGKAHIVPGNDLYANQFFQVNVEGTRHLLQGLLSSGYLPKQFVFISSVAVYGREEGVQIDETSPLLGTSPYAESKIEAENLLTEWCNKNRVLLTILRLPLLVGENPPGNLGSMIKWMKRGWYVGIDSGQSRKSMVLASDVAKFIPQVSAIGGIYNLADGHHPSMRELEIAIASRMGKHAPKQFPYSLINRMAKFGDLLGHKFPINSDKLKKLTSTLTFSDSRARAKAGWKPNSVVENLPLLL